MSKRRAYGLIGFTAGVGLALAMLGSGGSAAAHVSGAGRAAKADGRIVFADNDSGALFTVNPDGSALVQVTAPGPDGFATTPDWTPDGTHLVYAASVDNGDFRLYEIRADGMHRRLLARDKHGYQDAGPRVTPDGRWLYFQRCRPDPPGGCNIVRMRINGAHRHPITHFHSPRTTGDEGYAFLSPNGRHLAYNEFERNGIYAQVWISRPDGTHAHPITAPALEADAYSWTPDSKSLLVTNHWFHLGEGIYRVPIGDGRPVRLLQPPYWHQDWLPDISPSGDAMTFISDIDSVMPNQPQLFISNPNGSSAHRVDVGSDAVVWPRWGTAPLLPASVATPTGRLAPPLPLHQRRRLESRLSYLHDAALRVE